MEKAPTDEISSIAKGKFFLTRSPRSPKGSLECLYNDAYITIKQTTRPFYYQICVNKVYQQGEIAYDNLESSDDEDDEESTNADSAAKSKDEWTFIVLDELSFRFIKNNTALTWCDMNGDTGDRFEFVIDDDVRSSDVEVFKNSLYRCLYELKYHRVCDNEDDLMEFERDAEAEAEAEEEEEEEEDIVFLDKLSSSTNTAYSDDIDLYIFGGDKFMFAGEAKLSLVRSDKFESVIRLQNSTNIKFETVIGNSMNVSFEIEKLAFVFNHNRLDDNKALQCYTWLIHFADILKYSKFNEYFIKLYWEGINKKPYKDENIGFLENSLTRMKIDDEDDVFVSADEALDDEEEEKITSEPAEPAESGPSEIFGDKINSKLTVGFANDRSYVVKGNNLGVFKHDDELKFQTAISNLKDRKGNPIVPQKLMLQRQDDFLIIKDENDDKVYRMDLGRGTIVDEWDISDKMGNLKNFSSNKKLDELTVEQTFTAISSNSMFKLDPRAEQVVVQGESSTSKKNYNNINTTESGYLAVSSTDGTIRLFDRLGLKNAKTALPSLGDNIRHLDISNDGRWLLATCENYLLLIDNKIGKGQRNEGSLGFEKPFNADCKPVPMRLMLKPEHITAILNASGKTSLQFSPAKFNTSSGSKPETCIITGTGNYLVMFNLKNVLKNKEPKYLVKKFTDDIVLSDFKFGSTNAIVASEHDVSMASRQRFKRFK